MAAESPRRSAIVRCARVCADQGGAPLLALEDAAQERARIGDDDPLAIGLRARADAAASHARFMGGLAQTAARLAEAATTPPPLASAQEAAPTAVRIGEYFLALAQARAEALAAAWLPGVAVNLRQLPAPPADDHVGAVQAQVSSYFREAIFDAEKRGDAEQPVLPAVAPALRAVLPQLAAALRDEARFAALAQRVSQHLADQDTSRQRTGGGLMRWFQPRTRPIPNRHLVAAAGQAARTRAPDDPSGVESPYEAPPEGEQPQSGRASNASHAQPPDSPTPTNDPGSQDPNPALPPELRANYRVFTRAHDRVVNAHQLAHPEELERLRKRLDRAVAPYRSVMQRLAHRLQRRLQASQQPRWWHEQDEGELDPSRLAQIVTRPLESNVFRQLRDAPGGPTAVTLLIDNSGSMRGHPMAVAAVTVDLLAQTLERCRIATEILGYTTVHRRQSAAFQDWLSAGSPPQPGRLNGLQHIVYKSMDTPWRRCRRDLGLMLKDEILRENIDGEALWWASQRLRLRPEARRLLIVISDGAPRDTDTLANNPGAYLDNHLHQVIHWLRHRTDISLYAIGIGHAVNRYYPQSVTLRSVESLGEVLTRQVGDWLVGGQPSK